MPFMSTGNLDINLLGVSFQIQANESQEYLRSLYSYYKSKVDEVSASVGTADPLKIAIISGIIIADELKKEKLTYTNLSDEDRNNFEIEQTTRRIFDLINTIDEIDKIESEQLSSEDLD